MGICYGMQVIRINWGKVFQGLVNNGIVLHLITESPFYGLPEHYVWMTTEISRELPPIQVLAYTENSRLRMVDTQFSDSFHLK